MYVWKMSQTLTEPIDPEWQKLLTLAFGDSVHPERKKSFLLSRIALQNCLKEQGLCLNPSELVLNNHHEITCAKQFTLSLSHSKNIGAALVADRVSYRSVGIDVELKERIVKDSVCEKIANPKDCALRNIDLWCLKEAAFKTLMNTGLFDLPLTFSSITIAQDHWVHMPSKLFGQWELEIVRPFVVARAFLRNEKLFRP